MSDYEYRNLTSAVKDKNSPLRRYLNTRFPNTRAIQTDYRRDIGALAVDGGEANPGTVGAAFDFMTRFAVDPGYTADLAACGFVGNPQMLTAIGEVVSAAQSAVNGPDGHDMLARAAWVLAACTEVYRIGGLAPGSPLAPLIEQGQFNRTALLSLASDDARRQLRELHALAADRLRPEIRQANRIDIGPTFRAPAKS